jgi:hypothetical protein
MSLTLIKEDGSGKVDANTYALAADGDAWHDGHLYAAAWTGATSDRKASALVMATRVIDTMFRFHGFKRAASQALQWPRCECRDPDRLLGFVPGLTLARGTFLDETSVPPAIVHATCELARELIRLDRTDAPEGEGLRSLTLDGGMKVIFDPLRPRPMVPVLVQGMVNKYGAYIGGRSGAVPLIRA